MVFDNFVDGLVDYMIETALTLANAMFYPFYKILGALYADMMLIFTAFSDLFDSFTSFFATLYGFISYFLSSIFPTAWSLLILTGLTIVITLRLYKFLKDVSLGGFKV